MRGSQRKRSAGVFREDGSRMAREARWKKGGPRLKMRRMMARLGTRAQAGARQECVLARSSRASRALRRE